MAISRDLELANQSLTKFYDADYELQVMVTSWSFLAGLLAVSKSLCFWSLLSTVLYFCKPCYLFIFPLIKFLLQQCLHYFVIV